MITLIAYTGRGYPVEHNYNHEQLGELRMNINELIRLRIPFEVRFA